MSLEPVENTSGEADPPVEVKKSTVWLKRYPPLLIMIICLIITAMVLPSALNLPQANPSTVLEYAPVPPEDDDPPPPNDGAISELGLGSSSGLSSGGPGGGGTGGGLAGKGEKPITKRCVGKPARQTEDPNSPPCVPFFDGDNGGATWQGVTKDEITVLIYADTYITTGGSAGTEATPAAGQYCDVDKAPNSQTACLARSGNGVYASKGFDHQDVRVARAYSKYFNDRFQTYGRRVHIWIFWSAANSPSTRRADAQDNWDRLKPFAVMQRPQFGGYDEVYTEAIVKRRVMVFGALLPQPNSYYRKYAPMLWNFWPDVEHWADQFVAYVCAKVAPFPVTYSGNPSDNGKPRKYGIMYSTDRRFPSLTYFAQLVEEGVKSCPNGASVTFAERGPFRRHQYSIDTDPAAAQDADQNIAKFRQAQVTTVIWAGGMEAEHTKEAKERGWLPEWFVAGDQWHDYVGNARAQDQDVWSHAVLSSNLLREDRLEDAPCRQAYREAEPQGTQNDEDQSCSVYRDFFMLFKAIQVAGPYLGPAEVDQGQHAIPRQSSTSPFVASCFFDPGDFTCVKDSREAWWDKDAPDPDGDPEDRGCWRLVNGGQRYLPEDWPQKQEAFNRGVGEPCDSQDTNTQIHPYGPEDNE